MAVGRGSAAKTSRVAEVRVGRWLNACRQAEDDNHGSWMQHPARSGFALPWLLCGFQPRSHFWPFWGRQERLAPLVSRTQSSASSLDCSTPASLNGPATSAGPSTELSTRSAARATSQMSRRRKAAHLHSVLPQTEASSSRHYTALLYQSLALTAALLPHVDTATWISPCNKGCAHVLVHTATSTEPYDRRAPLRYV